MIFNIRITKFYIPISLCIVLILLPTMIYGVSLKSKKEIVLTGTSIDLLIGTPKGVNEPLDNRRLADQKPKINFDKFLNEWEELSDQGTVSWDNAEEQQSEVSETKFESQYLDLVADLEIDEIIKPLIATSTLEQNMSNSVATNNEL